jgi:hypothetical protein
MCGQPVLALLAHFLMYICGELAGAAISYRGKAEPKKSLTKSVLLAPWPSADPIFLRPGQGVTMNLLRGDEGLTLQSFKRDDRKNFSGP